MTVYQLREQIATLNVELENIRNKVATMAADPSAAMDAIRAEKTRAVGIEERVAVLQGELDRGEKEAKARLKDQLNKHEGELNPLRAKMEARGDFYRNVIKGASTRNIAQMSWEHLGAIPAADADLGSGENLLPHTMATDIITQPIEENPLRKLVHVTNLPNLTEPKLTFDIDADDFNDVTDKVTATEIAMSASGMVEYGRHKGKVKAEIADTVFRGSNYDLAAYIERSLRGGLGVLEMARLGAATPAAAYKHMSLYGTDANLLAVEEVSGANKMAAILAALGDLPTMYRQNSTIVMSGADWFGMWGTVINGSDTYHNDRPLILAGRPVVLCDYFAKPVIGDFSYIGLNYDIGSIYDVDKDVDKGVYKFVFTAWYDIQIRMRAAFRIAVVTAG